MPNEREMRAQRFHEVRKRSLYDSDTNGVDGLAGQSKDGTFRKILHERATSTSQKEPSTNRQPRPPVKRFSNIMSGPNLRRAAKKDDEFSVGYKYQPPVKDFSKYPPTRIKIVQDINAHAHLQKHPLTIFFH